MEALARAGGIPDPPTAATIPGVGTYIVPSAPAESGESTAVGDDEPTGEPES
jgi:hypothetical protein